MQIFNRFNAVEEVLLPPRQRVRVIVSFSPIDDGQTIAEVGEQTDDESLSQVIVLCITCPQIISDHEVTLMTI